MTNVTVLGAGAWGTAFGQVLADAGNNVTMWAIEPEIVEGIRDHHHNGVRLPSVKVLPSNMTATGDRAEAVANADIVIVAIAAQFARVALVEFKDLIPETALVASLMKGIERTTGKRMDEVVMETLDLPADRFAAISGPNLSKQIADREPAATVVACENLDNARKIAAAVVPTVIKDVDIAALNGNYAIQAGFDPTKDTLVTEKADGLAAKTYQNILVVKEGNENTAKTKELKKALKSDEVRDYINKNYKGAVVPVF